MKFSCTQENFYQGLQVVGHATSKNNSLPILNNVLLKIENKELRLLSTNLEIAVSATVRAKIEEDGDVTAPAKLLLEYLSVCSQGRVDVELKGSDLKIQTQNDTTIVKCVSSQDFPLVPPINKIVSYGLGAQDFKEALQKVMFAVSKNEARPELCGVYMDFCFSKEAVLTLAATDSYRLAEKKTPLLGNFGDKQYSKEPQKVIVPGKTIQEVLRVVGLFREDENQTPIEITIQDNQIVFSYGTVEIYSRLIEGKYPDYTQIIPHQFKTKIQVQVSEWIKRIKAASLFSNTGVQGVVFNFLGGNEQKVVISSISGQTGEHTSSVLSKIEGEDNKITLNYRYLLDGLMNLFVEEAEFHIVSSESPCVLRPKGSEDFLYIIMPIRQ